MTDQYVTSTLETFEGSCIAPHEYEVGYREETRQMTAALQSETTAQQAFLFCRRCGDVRDTTSTESKEN